MAWARLTLSASRSAQGVLGGGADPAASREPTQARPKRAPSSSPKLTTASGVGARPPAPQHVQGGEGGHHAERPVEGTAVRHGVQVRPGDDGSPAAGSPRQAHWLPLRSATRTRGPRAAAASGTTPGSPRRPRSTRNGGSRPCANCARCRARSRHMAWKPWPPAEPPGAGVPLPGGRGPRPGAGSVPTRRRRSRAPPWPVPGGARVAAPR